MKDDPKPDVDFLKPPLFDVELLFLFPKLLEPLLEPPLLLFLKLEPPEDDFFLSALTDAAEEAMMTAMSTLVISFPGMFIVLPFSDSVG